MAGPVLHHAKKGTPFSRKEYGSKWGTGTENSRRMQFLRTSEAPPSRRLREKDGAPAFGSICFYFFKVVARKSVVRFHASAASAAR
jgi:hypothetical protein